jgi:hypothetical protein
MELLPSLGLFSGLTSVLWCFSVMVGRTPSHRGLAVVILINVLMGLYWVVVSVRRFRWPQLAPLTPRAAWCLAVIWLVVSTLGLMRPDYNLGWGGGQPDLNAMATLFATIALGALPCLMAVDEQRRTVIRCSGLDLRQRLRPWFWVAAGAVVVLAQAWSIGRLSPSAGAAAAWASRPVLLAILPLLGTLMACAVGRLLYFLLVRHSPAVVLLCALWVGPPALNFFYMAHQGVPIDPAHLSWVGTSSPLGAIVVLWYGAALPSEEDAPPGRGDDAAQGRLPLSLRAGPAIGAALTLLAWLAGSQVLRRFVQRRQALR